MFSWWITDNPGRINKHVNTLTKPKKRTFPDGMTKEFVELSARKKQGLITQEQFDQQKETILKKYGIK